MSVFVCWEDVRRDFDEDIVIVRDEMGKVFGGTVYMYTVVVVFVK